MEEKKVLYRKLKVQNLQDWFGTPTRPQWVANMAAVMSVKALCLRAILIWLLRLGWFRVELPYGTLFGNDF